jgi:hypothetical protein
LSAPVDWEPLVAWVPDQPPEAVQEVAFVADQLKVELLPLTMELGLAARLTVGAGAAEVTETVAAWAALPPAPVHVREYVALALRAPVDCEPLEAFVPDQAPEAVQAVALLADQLRTALPPLAIVLGLADKATVGAGAVTDTVFDCVALPPVPVQVSE